MNYSFTIILRITFEFIEYSNLSCSNSIHLFENTLEILFLEIFIKSIEISLQCSMFKSTRDTLKPITTHAHTAAILGR